MFKKSMNHLREMVQQTKIGETFLMNNVDKELKRTSEELIVE
jgi:hypothetical protein